MAKEFKVLLIHFIRFYWKEVVIMGQHKTNLTAIKAANGEIPPKPSKMSKSECNRLLYSICNTVISFPFTEFVEEKEIKSKNNKGDEIM